MTIEINGVDATQPQILQIVADLGLDDSTLMEKVQDWVAAMLTQGSNITLTYNDTTGKLTIASTGGGGGGGGGGLGDGDYGDVVVSGTGTVLTIDAKAVTLSKMADLSTKTYIGRTTAGTGAPEAVPISTLKTDLGLVKADVGLSNVDNVADSSKPVSTAQATAIGARLLAASNLSDVASAATARSNIGAAPTASPVFTGPVKQDGVSVLTPYSISGGVIQTDKARGTYSSATIQTFTFSATPSDAGTMFAADVANTDGSNSRDYTIPSSYSLTQQRAITSLTMPPNSRALLVWIWNGSIFELMGEPPLSMRMQIGATISTSRNLLASDFDDRVPILFPVDTSSANVVLTLNAGIVGKAQRAFFQRRGANALTIVAGTGTIGGTASPPSDTDIIGLVGDPLTTDKGILV